MSNFWKSKTVIFSLVFGGVSLLAIIGGSVMLAIANNNKFQSSKLKLQNDNKTKSNPNSKNTISTYDWYGNVNFIPYEILRVKNPNSDWRPITESSINQGDKKDKGYEFYQDDPANNFNIYLKIAHHNDTQFEIDFNKLKASDVLYNVSANDKVNPSEDNNLTLNWSITKIAPDPTYTITNPTKNVFIIKNDNIDQPYKSVDFKVGLEITNNQNQTQTLNDVNLNISGTKQNYNWKGNINLIGYEMLKVATDNTSYRLITEKSIASGGDRGYWFIQNGDNYNFELSYDHHSDNWFRLDFNKLRPSDILDVQDWVNDSIELIWDLKQTNPNSSFVVEPNATNNVFEIINKNPSNPFGTEVFELTLTIRDKWADPGLEYFDLPPVQLILKNQNYQFKAMNLLEFNNILNAGKENPNDLININAQSAPGYEFKIIEPNILNINIANYNSRYFKIDLSLLKPSDIFKDVLPNLNANLEWSWSIDNNSSVQSNALIENNILTFTYDQTYPNIASLLLTIKNKTLNNPAQSVLKLDIKIDGNQLFIPSTAYVEEKATLSVEPSYIRGINSTDNVRYQWQFSDGSAIDNQTNPTLSVDNVKSSQWNNKQIQLAIFINNSQIPIISNICNIQVTQPPPPIQMLVEITPDVNNIIQGQNLVISPNLISDDKYDLSSFKYQWIDVDNNNQPFANQITKEFRIDNISRKEWDNRKVKLVINYGKQRFESNIATIVVNPDMKISLDKAIDVVESSNLIIQPTITNTDNVDESTFQYQWVNAVDNTEITGQTKRNFQINNVSLSWNNQQVKLIVFYRKQRYESNPITINVYNNITVSLNKSMTILEKQNLTITPNIVGNVNQNELTYQWFSKRSQSTRWTKINNQNKKDLTINQIGLDWNQKDVKLVVTHHNKSFESNVCTINVYPNIKIDLNPQINAIEQKELIISPTISGIENINETSLTYQWVDASTNRPIANQTNKDFHLTVLDQQWNNKQLKLIVTYENRNYESNITTIIVNDKITITTPNEISLKENDNLRIDAQVKGIEPSEQTRVLYQWYSLENNQLKPIVNQTTSILNIYGVDLSWNNKQVKLMITLDNKTYYSNPTNIKVIPNTITPTPPIDPTPPNPLPPDPPTDNKPTPPVDPTPPNENTKPKPKPVYVGISPSNYGFLYDANGNLISSQHWEGDYLANVQKARTLLVEINNKLMNPQLTSQEREMLNLQKDICNNMILTSNLIISGSILVGVFGIGLFAILIVFIRYAYWYF